MRTLVFPVLAFGLAACADVPPRFEGLDPALRGEVQSTAQRKRETPSAAVDQALLPPPQMEMPVVRGVPLDAKFDLSVQNAPAAQVFYSLVSGTRYSMLLHPGLSGSVSLNLKDVTIREALDAMHELYGYDYRMEGTRIFVQAAGLQSRIFQVNYLTGQRKGLSEVRVQSGAVSENVSPGGGAGAPATTGGATGSRSLESSHVRTEQLSDFWLDLRAALTTIVGAGEGRSVVVTPHSGVVVVRAFPAELRAVESYLSATRVSVERQVMLEAKIVEVTLSDSFQSGINWAAFSRDNLSVGQLSRGTALNSGRISNFSATGASSVSGGVPASVLNPAQSAFAGEDFVNHTLAGGSVFGLALATRNFAALLNFLETQGNVQVLSSPRIATVNNQKAVLKVGTDEFFVTAVTTTSTTTGTATQTTPTVTVQPFFSGIVLDVTPQVDPAGNIILHIHPAVSEVTESTRVVNLGGQIAEIRLPLAKSTVSESDTIVRVSDGNIVAIGGLMSVSIRDARGGLPGVDNDSFAGLLFRNTDRATVKKELVILLKPTVIESDRQWAEDLRQTRERYDALDRPVRR
jgi:MSHA biogenesis protein MshL